MKLKEAFAKRKTYERTPEIRVDALKKALDEYNRIADWKNLHGSELWREVHEDVKQHMRDYPDDDPIYQTYQTTIAFMYWDLKAAFTKI